MLYSSAKEINHPTFWKQLKECKRTVRRFGKSKTRNIDDICVKIIEKILSGIYPAVSMNECYTNIGETLASKFLISLTNPYPINCPPLTRQEFQFRFITEKETVSLIKSLKLSKSSHVEGINITFLRDGLLIAEMELAHLINECLRLSCMPELWAVGTITPIPKKGISLNVSDYRPISVLPAPSKAHILLDTGFALTTKRK